VKRNARRDPLALDYGQYLLCTPQGERVETFSDLDALAERLGR
jgi:hypothetical protein